jgi:hypothetical protein
MADYKQRSSTAMEWQRCSGVFINNPYNGAPTVRMDEEIVANVGDKVYVNGVGCLNFNFNPEEVINIRNPSTGELVGASATSLDIYVLLYSLYIQKALERDESSIVPQSDPEPEPELIT